MAPNDNHGEVRPPQWAFIGPGAATLVVAAVGIIMAFATVQMFSTSSRIDALYIDIGTMKADIASIKTTVEFLTEDIGEMKQTLKDIYIKVAADEVLPEGAGAFTAMYVLFPDGAKSVNAALSSKAILEGVLVVQPADSAAQKALDAAVVEGWVLPGAKKF